MTLTLYGREREKALKACEAEIYRLEGIFSVTDSGSEVYRINESRGGPVEISEDMREVASVALEAGRETGYLFDITVYPLVEAWGFYDKAYRVPKEAEIASILRKVGADRLRLKGNLLFLDEGQKIDLGGIVKGYLSDRIGEILEEYGIKRAVISLGGSILVRGTKADGSLWRIGIEDPFKNNLYIGILEITDTSVVTSGDYERYFIEDGVKYHHIFDPASGYPATNGLVSVTVVMPSGTEAEVLSTALFIMGEQGAIGYQKTRNDFEMILINTGREILVTGGLRDIFTAAEDEGFTVRWI